jgi:hypothetical protein
MIIFMVAEGAADAVNIFTLDGPTATGEGMLRAAPSFTAQTTRGLSAGFELQARFEGSVDAKLADAVRASFRTSGSVSVGADGSTEVTPRPPSPVASRCLTPIASRNSHA